MMDGTGGNGSVGPAAAAFNVHQQLSEANRIFQQNSYNAAAAAAGVVSPFSGHMGTHHNSALQQHAHHHHHHHPHGNAGGPHQNQQHSHNAVAAAAAAAVAAMGQSPHGGVGLSQLPHGLSNASQSIAAALFASSPLISDDIKIAAAAAAAAAAAQSSRGKKSHRAEPVPQSGFKGVSWNSRMKAWLAFYVTENGERKSKTFSTRKLGMEEARLQAIAFCKQKQDQRRERKRNREMQNQHCGGGNGIDKLSSDESMIDSPASGLSHLHHHPPDGSARSSTSSPPPSGTSAPSAQQAAAAAAAAMRCGYPTTPGLGVTNVMAGPSGSGSTGVASAGNGSEIAYVPIVPIAMNMIEKSGLLQPLELNELPPCQHCNKQPYPFLMIVSEGQEQTYSGSSIMSLASHSNGSPSGNSGPPCSSNGVSGPNNSLGQQGMNDNSSPGVTGQTSSSSGCSGSGSMLHQIPKPNGSPLGNNSTNNHTSTVISDRLSTNGDQTSNLENHCIKDSDIDPRCDVTCTDSVQNESRDDSSSVMTGNGGDRRMSSMIDLGSGYTGHELLEAQVKLQQGNGSNGGDNDTTNHQLSDAYRLEAQLNLNHHLSQLAAAAAAHQHHITQQQIHLNLNHHLGHLHMFQRQQHLSNSSTDPESNNNNNMSTVTQNASNNNNNNNNQHHKNNNNNTTNFNATTTSTSSAGMNILGLTGTSQGLDIRQDCSGLMQHLGHQGNHTNRDTNDHPNLNIHDDIHNGPIPTTSNSCHSINQSVSSSHHGDPNHTLGDSGDDTTIERVISQRGANINGKNHRRENVPLHELPSYTEDQENNDHIMNNNTMDGGGILA